jgi:hypothetical protein
MSKVERLRCVGASVVLQLHFAVRKRMCCFYHAALCCVGTDIVLLCWAALFTIQA